MQWGHYKGIAQLSESTSQEAVLGASFFGEWKSGGQHGAVDYNLR